MNLVQPSLPLPGTAADLARTQARDSARIKDVAKQFEGQFAQMLVKSMRDASPGDSLFPGENQLFREMYDQQIAKKLTEGRGLGLAPMIERQLGGSAAAKTDAGQATATSSQALAQYRKLLPSTQAGEQMLDAIAGRGTGSATTSRSSVLPSLMDTLSPPSDGGNGDDADGSPLDRLIGVLMGRKNGGDGNDSGSNAITMPAGGKHSPESFVSAIWQHAQSAASELGVDPRALVAQAALETGWGKKVMRRNDGSSAHNLFGIKSTGWSGDSVRRSTQEYRNGVAGTEKADFRAYSSAKESFADYVRMLKNNPRYQQALAAGGDVRGFANALQKAGYATDPGYASKIAAIANGPLLNRAISSVTNAIASR